MNDKNRIEDYLQLAFSLAFQNFFLNEVPVGAVLTKNWTFIASATNKRKWHAEEILINNYYGTEIFVSLEPCSSCFLKLHNAGIKKVFWIIPNYKQYINPYKLNIDIWPFATNLKEQNILQNFFTKIRSKNNKNYI